MTSSDLDLDLRAVELGHLATVAALEQSCFGESGSYGYAVLRQFFDLGADLWRIAYLHEVPVGHCIAAATCDGSVWLLSIGVATPHRGTGVGSALITHLEDSARTAGHTRIALTVHPDNAAAISLYERHGIGVLDDEPEYFGANQPRLVMAKSIAQSP